MNEKTKERIVGGVTLACLAFIFIPPFYDGRNPFDADGLAPSRDIPRAPGFPSTEKFANELAASGEGRLANIERKVKKANPEESNNDSLLETKDNSFYSNKLDEFSASDMTRKLLSDITENTALGNNRNSRQDMKKAWAVQVASFKKAENAQLLRDKLIQEGFQAYIKTLWKDGEATSRVFAGVSLDKAVVERIRDESNKKFPEQKAMVVTYVP